MVVSHLIDNSDNTDDNNNDNDNDDNSNNNDDDNTNNDNEDNSNNNGNDDNTCEPPVNGRKFLKCFKLCFVKSKSSEFVLRSI